MWENLVGEEIRRVCRNRAVTCAALACVGIWGLSAGWNRIRNGLEGPYTADSLTVSLMDGRHFPDRYHVTLTGDALSATGLQSVFRQGSSSRPGSLFYLLSLGSRFLLVRSDRTLSVPDDKTLTGTLVPLTSIALAAHDRLTESKDLQGALLPGVLDMTASPRRDAVLLILGLSLLLFPGLFGFWNGLVGLRNPESYRGIRPLTEAGDARATILQIEGEAREPGLGWIKGGLGRVMVTRSWFLYGDLFRFGVARLDRAAWAYAKVTKQRVNGIPAGSHYALVLHDRDGKVLEVRLSKASVPQALARLNERAPWIVMGHQEERAALWRKNRAAFVAEVDRRMAEGKAAGGKSAA